MIIAFVISLIVFLAAVFYWNFNRHREFRAELQKKLPSHPIPHLVSLWKKVTLLFLPVLESDSRPT